MRIGRLVLAPMAGGTSTPALAAAVSNAGGLGSLGAAYLTPGQIAAEVAEEGVTVNTVATGRFATDRLASYWGSWEEMERHAHAGVPAARLGQPEEYGDLVAFLCSERAAYLTGAVIPLDGGLLRST